MSRTFIVEALSIHVLPETESTSSLSSVTIRVGDHVAPPLSCCTRLDDGVLIGCRLQPVLQAREVAGFQSFWPCLVNEPAGHD